MSRTAEIQANINDWTDSHRRWLKEGIRECGHHEMYFHKGRNVCIVCKREADRGYVSLEEALALAYADSDDDKILAKVYMPNGSLVGYGFNGGGPASDRQKHAVRVLLAKHAGNPTVEAIRRYLNKRARSGETVTVSDVSPAISWMRTL
jgi:hypothetical protein